MSILLTISISIFILIISKHLFKKWFNHLSLYTIIWMGMIVLYELKLIRYKNLSIETWVIIIGASLAYFLGIITFFAARNSDNDSKTNQSNLINTPSIISDNGLIIKYLILLFGIIGLFDAFYQWHLLLSKFGSLILIIVQADSIRQMRLQGDIKGMIPYLFIVSYLGIFLSGIYTAYKNKITLIGILPILAIAIKELANMSRAGILFGLFEFFIVFFLFRHLLISKGFILNIKRGKIIFATILIAIILIGSAILIKTFRRPVDQFQASSRELTTYKTNILISPSIYLYTSSHIGVLNKYLEHESEKTKWGENTFLPIYNFLSKFNFVEHPKIFQKKYSIPVWTNTGTYLREIHADFGYVGLFTIPFLLGLLTTFYWFRFFEYSNLRYLIILTYLNLIISFSFFVMITRLASWSLSLIILLVIVPIIERFTLYFSDLKSKKEISSIS